MDYFVKKSDQWSIDLEETLLDRRSADTFDYAQLEMPMSSRSLIILFAAVFVCVFAFFSRAAYLQTWSGATYAKMAVDNKTRGQPILAKRGIVYDRNNVPLVENVPSFDIVAIPADLPRNKQERERMVRELAAVIGVPEDELLSRFSRMSLAGVAPVLVHEDAVRDVALLLETKTKEFPGISVKKNAVRRYPEKEYFSHVLGYVGRVSESDMEKNEGLFPIDSIGKMGIEGSYDVFLRGVNGIIEREINAVSRITNERQVREDTIGANVILTIDAGLQKKITDVLVRAMAEAPSARGAAAAALDPSTGEVLALVSVPSYDNNIFATATSRQAYQRLERDPLHPFFNRVIAGTYPPGSSLKPFVALAALQEGTITAKTTVVSTGAIVVHNPYNPDASQLFRDWKEGGHGVVDVYKAIAESVNTFFYAIGGGYGDIDGLGIQRIKKYLTLFGFGSETRVDVKGEGAGVIPDQAWKEKELGAKWVLGDTYNASIGQGNILVTPLQLARAYAALANGGNLVQPYLVKAVVVNNKKTGMETTPVITAIGGIDDAYFAIMRDALRQTVTDGSGRRLADLPVAVAGKTGTAQAQRGNTHAWFSSFAPFDDPTIALVILVEDGGEGSAVAVPAAREIYEWYFSNDR